MGFRHVSVMSQVSKKKMSRVRIVTQKANFVPHMGRCTFNNMNTISTQVSSMQAQCLLTNAAHLHRNAKRGRTLSIQALECGDEEAVVGVAVADKGIAALPDTVHKLGITTEPARAPGPMMS